MKKIAWILHGPYRNEGRVYKESQTMSKAGYQIKIFATWDKGLPFVQYEGEIKVERISFPILSFLRLPINKMSFFMPFYTLKVLWRLWRYKPDIVHCMNFWTLPIGYLGKILFKIPYVYDSHDLFMGQNEMKDKKPRAKAFFMAGEKYFSQHAAVVIQTTGSRSEQFTRFYGLKAAVIMNKAVFSAAPTTTHSLKDQLALKTKKHKLVYVGNILSFRGLEQLLEATAGMNDVQLYVLGRTIGAYGDDLLKANQERLILIPAVHPGEIADALKVFDLGISLIQNSCLSYFLECPTKVWELISSGTPQLASDFPEIRRVIIDNGVGPVGRVVDPANIKQIRDNIRALLNDPAERERYKNNCAKLKSACAWETEGKKLVGLYDSLVGK